MHAAVAFYVLSTCCMSGWLRPKYSQLITPFICPLFQWLGGEIDPDIGCSWVVWNRKQLDKVAVFFEG